MEAEGFQSGKILKILNPQTIQFMEFSRPEYWSGQLFPSPGNLPNPGMEPRSPALWADFLLVKPQGKPKKPTVLNRLSWLALRQCII